MSEVRVISDAVVLRCLFGPKWMEADSYSEESCDRFVKWCEEHNAYYYAGHADSFNIASAMHMADINGYTLVVAENLS